MLNDELPLLENLMSARIDEDNPENGYFTFFGGGSYYGPIEPSNSNAGDDSVVTNTPSTPSPQTTVTPSPESGMLPEAPKRLRFPAKYISSNRIVFVWDSADYAVDYDVAYQRKGASKWNIVRSVKDTYLNVKGLKSDQTYRFAVRGKNALGIKKKWNKMIIFYSNNNNTII